MNRMEKDCKECELAIFCFTNPQTWIFRTKGEMAEKLKEIERCPVHRRLCVENIIEPLPSLEKLLK